MQALKVREDFGGILLRRILSISILAALVTILPGSYAYAETTYLGYTYNTWDEAVPSPAGYVPERFYSGADIGAGNLKEPQDIFVDRENEIMYVVDSGNNRILLLDRDYKAFRTVEIFTSPKGQETLNNPRGIYVDNTGTMYIADQGNSRILVSEKNGSIKKIIETPRSDLIPENFQFKPDKLVVDKAGRIYVQCTGVFQGLICFDENGSFNRFYGSNRVDVTVSLLRDMLWRKLLTKEQKDKMIRFIPIEYSNVYIDNEDFIYAVVRKSENSNREIKKLNALGINVLRIGKNSVYASSDYGDRPVIYDRGFMVDTAFVDVNVDDDNFINALDSTRGRIFQYDQESNMLFVFGGIGEQLGTFESPAAIESMNKKIIVLDSKKNGFTVFRASDFGKLVKKAVNLYNEGRYREALEPWEEVLERNCNYELAYIGIGQAYMNMEKYIPAMKNFKLGYDKYGYSRAYKEYAVDIVREYFGTIAILLILIVVISKIYKNRRAIVNKYRIKRELRKR